MKTLKLQDYPELCFGLPEMQMIDPTFTQVSPIIIKRGETGYYQTDWIWTKTIAKQALDDRNARLGVSPEMAERMKACSMFGWPEAEPRRRPHEVRGSAASNACFGG
jgi:hypothetical protein